jgi:Zn-dependent alcohol dehydrogenase
VKITAAVPRERAQPFSIEELDLDEPRDDEVLVRLVATGIWRTYLSTRDRGVGPRPAVLGHEGAGVVEQVGWRVTRVAPGDHVVLTFLSCGTCGNCARGRPVIARTWANSIPSERRRMARRPWGKATRRSTGAFSASRPSPRVPWFRSATW